MIFKFREKEMVMKKHVLALSILLALCGCGSAAFAKTNGIATGADNNIRYTVHNMSNNGFGIGRYIYSNHEDQVCVFCHTPHNAKPVVPLWNKVLPTQAFNMYTSSSTLSPTAKLVTTPGPESMLCLSCHDGRTAINVLHNTSNTFVQTSGTDKVVDMGGGGPDIYSDGITTPAGIALGAYGFSNYGANLGKLNDGSNITDSLYGGNLTNDHPISFSYTKVQGEDSKLQTAVYAESKGIRFFGGDKRLECSSCHNPHVAYGWTTMGATGVGDPTLKPFLVRDNIGSALCLACHDK
jgi:hypothetical protein